MLRRSNCRAFFPPLAKWYSELFPADHSGVQTSRASCDHRPPPLRGSPGGRVGASRGPIWYGHGWVGAHHTSRHD
eukprot:11273221-Alexandrium_andersonii.AAC.1